MSLLDFVKGGIPLPDLFDLLTSSLEGMPGELRRPATELIEMLTGASSFGPEDPPQWARVMFEATARESGLSSELLASIAWAMSRFDPAHHPGFPRVGLMGIPSHILADPSAVSAPLEDVVGLREGAAPPGWAPVLLNVRSAALYIARARAQASGGILEAVAGYAGADALPRVLGAYVLFLGRKAAASRARTQEVLNGN